ncbi:MAG: hypothetical protein FWG19_03660 [Methanomassiliicoccaceae archaeon]|nr:hypothetical protein [Methanomassiliicoccaceae archaeon]
MHTDADGNMVFSSQWNDTAHTMTIIMLVACVYFLCFGIVLLIDQEYTGYAFVLLGLFFGGLALFFRHRTFEYTFEKKGVGFDVSIIEGSHLFVSYDEIMKFHETRMNAHNDGIMLYYIRENKTEGRAVLLPIEKEIFISELIRRTGISLSEDPHAKK